jgi:hypothetical protein
MKKLLPVVTFDSTPLRGREGPMVEMLLVVLEQVAVMPFIVREQEVPAELKRLLAENIAALMTQRFPDLKFQVDTRATP